MDSFEPSAFRTQNIDLHIFRSKEQLGADRCRTLQCGRAVAV